MPFPSLVVACRTNTLLQSLCCYSDVELDPEMVSRVQAEQNLNLGTDLEVSRCIFDRSDELTLTASSSSSRAKLG